MDSSVTATKHGWPKSAPPKLPREDPSENKQSNHFAQNTSDDPCTLPDHASNILTIPRRGQNRQRYSLHHDFRPPTDRLPKTGRPRISLPTTISSTTATSNRRAVLIGVTYTGTKGISYRSDNIEHVLNLFQLLTVKLRFRRDNVWLLTDAPEKAVGCPVKLGATRQNILTSLRWLVNGSKGGDILFLGFSGLCGTVTKQGSNREILSKDCLLPSDYPALPPIPEDEISSLFARELHVNASLTAVLDSRDSSKVLKLPFIQSVYRKSRSTYFVTEILADDQGLIKSPTYENTGPRFFNNRLKKECNQIRRQLAEKKRDSLASAFSESGKMIAFGFAGIPEQKRQTSRVKSTPIGSLTEAFVNCISQTITGENGYTYESVLMNMGNVIPLERSFQLPQVSSSHRLDVYTSLALLGIKGSSHI